jgi:NitT/TauT family transport system substrate-binding protein
MHFTRRHLLATGSALAAAAMLPARSFAGQPLRLTSVKSGSVGWLIETIKAEGLDKKYGVDLDIIEVANNAAAPVTLLAGEADVVVSDWTWALRQRSKGEDFKFAAYSSALGSLIVPKDSAIKTIADLEGKKVGIAGSSADKSWVLMRAYSRKLLGKDISKMCETTFGAAPLITEEFKAGRLDACLNFWTFAARLIGDGARQIVSMADVIKALDISPAPPLVGFIWSEKVAKEKSLPIESLLNMVNEANDILAKSEPAWERLRPLVKPATEEEFAAIKTAFRAGITKPWTLADTEAAGKLTKLLIELGDTELVGDGTRFDPNLFHIKAG